MLIVSTDTQTDKEAEHEPQTEDGVRFLQTIFEPEDLVCFRPIESWTENGKKLPRVDWKGIRYDRGGLADGAGKWVWAPPSCSVSFETRLAIIKARSEQERTNVFFGVCPRYASQRYDLAWQIRVFRVLWCDVDHVAVDEALRRCGAADLPQPSILVNSGHGAHLYWLLTEAFLIDDAGGNPVPAFTEFVDQGPEKKKKPRKYIIDQATQERLYLDVRSNVPPLSPKAQYVQDINAGIASKIGGDHTTDLSRLLRVPGTWNRKNQRNGQEPVLCTLVECDPSRRYPIDDFAQFVEASPQKAHREKVAKVRLPTHRKLTAKGTDKFNALVLASDTAPVGQRSEPDFALCCWAVEHGMTREAVWAEVQSIGKFSGDERYFDRTWTAAENHTRETILDKGRGGKIAEKLLRNCEHGVQDDDDRGAGGRPMILVDPQTMPVGDTLHQVTDRLLATGHCFSRADQLVVVHNDTITPILSSPELGGLLNEYVEFFFVGEEAGQYKPLPPAYANTWLNQRAERNRLPVIKLFTRNPVYTEDWRLVAPGYDASSGIYYAGPAVEVRNSVDRLDALLRDFCFKAPADRTNYLAMLLTALLVPRFVGSKPAALFNGNQPELGKTILAQIIATLRDGHPAETATYNPNDEEFEKRLGAIVRRGVTTIIIDNAKGRARNPRIESACLERSITDPILSFRLLGYSQEIRAENSHIFCITANTPDVSRDLVTRSAVINLYYEGDPKRREFSIVDPEGYAEQHRPELLGELVGMVERWKAAGMPMASVQSRFNKRGWGTIVGGILDVCGEPDFLANAEEAAALLDDTHRDFVELVGVLVEHPQGLWTAAELVELCGKHGLLAADLGDGSPRSLATKMGTLAGRFVGERFPLADGRAAVFHRQTDRKGKVYRVAVEDEVPNLGRFAEPMLNLPELAGSAL